jgi:hypothetical protein
MVEWDVTAMLLDGTELSGMMSTLFAENPATGKSIGPIFLSETTHVHRPELQTFRELNSREFIPVFNGNEV